MELYSWFLFDETNYITGLLDTWNPSYKCSLVIINIGITDGNCLLPSECNLTCNSEACRYDW